MNPSSGPLTNPWVDLYSAWDEAYKLFQSRLEPKELRQLQASNQQQTTYSNLLADVEAAGKIVEDKRYAFTGKVQKIVKAINQYAVVADIMVQHNPENTALAWGAFRFIFLAAVAEGSTSEKIVDSLDQIAGIVFRADTYTSLFAHHRTSARDVLRQLHDGLIALFAEIFIFLFRAMAFFKKPTARRYLSAAFQPFSSRFKGTLENISRFERGVQDDIHLLTIESEILQQAVENGKWLRHAEGGFSSDLKKLCDEHLDGTCKWFLRNDIVENWKSPRSVPGLWVSGKPGCGKSTIASQLILHLSTSTLPVVRVLCKAGMENRSDVMSVLRNILFQLVESPVTTSEKRKLHSVITAARMDSKDPCATSEPKLWVLLKRLLKHSGGCICVIDGLDECGNTSKEIADFITQLTDVFDASPKSKAVVFSRLDIPVTCNNTSVWESISIKVADVRDDIEYLVRVNVENLELRNPEVKDRLRRQLISGSEGMMLWARLMLSEIKYNHYRIDEVLKKPPVGLKVLYNDILQRLANSESDTRRMQNALVLRLVLAAARPLRLHEFCLAVEMLKGLPDHENYEFREDNARTIINEAAPLVTVLPNNTVQIVHTSLKDYLLSSGYSQDTRLNNFVFESSNLHSPIVFALLSYLSFSCFNVNLVGAPVDHVNSYPLLEYASTQLIWHVTKVDDHYQDCLQQLRTFLESTQGWRWLERLRYTYECSMGHLQLFEAHLKGWIDTFSPKLSDREIFDNLLTHLCQKQVNDTIQCNADSERHLEAISSLAEVYWSKGKLKEAEDRIVYVMEMRKSELGHEHPTTLTSTNNLSLIYNDQGRWKEAMELLADVMETRIRVLGQEHPDTLISMSSLATIYQNQGQWRRAENLKLKVLEVRRRDLGQEHPYTLMSQSNLAVTYQQQGRWREAEELQVEVLKIEKRVLGRLHPETLRGMSNLAWTYMKLGGLKEAEELQVRALRTRKKVLGQEHPDTLESMSSMAWIYQSKGFIDDAISLIEQLVELRLKTLGADHPCTKDSIEDMMAWRESRVEASTGHPGKASF